MKETNRHGQKARKPLMAATVAGLVLGLSACQPAGVEGQNATTDGNKPAAAAKAGPYQQYLQDLSRRHLQPAYHYLAEQAQGLSASLQQVCTSSESEKQSQWAQVRQNWQQLMQAWQAVQWMQLGPVSESSRHQRLQYWPDGNDAVGRGVTKLLLTPQVPDAQAMSQINVGAQGLPALERLLFSEQDKLKGTPAHQCAVAQAIANNVSAIASAVDQQWQQQDGFIRQLTSGSGEFNGEKDAVEELTSNWLAQLIVTIDNRLTYPLSVASPGIPPLAESPLSDVSMQSVRTLLKSMRTILTAADGYGLDDILAQQGQQELAAQLLAQLDKSIALADSLPDSFTQALAQPESWQQLQQLTVELKAFQKLMVEGVVMQLQLNIGFNALDGD